MAQKDKAQLQTAIDALYQDCGTECITPGAVNAFEIDKTDSYAILNEDNDFSGVGSWTKQIREHKGANITVGSALSLTDDGNYFHVTGASTTINSIEARQHGTQVSFYFVNSHTLTHSTNLRLPNATDYKVAAGEILEFVSEGSGNWRFKASNKVISGQYTPTVSGFDGVTNVASLFSVQGNIMTSTHRLLVDNTSAAIAGSITITPPSGISIDSGLLENVAGTWSLYDGRQYSEFKVVNIVQDGGAILIEIELSTPPTEFTIYLSCQSKLA